MEDKKGDDAIERGDSEEAVVDLGEEASAEEGSIEAVDSEADAFEIEPEEEPGDTVAAAADRNIVDLINRVDKTGSAIVRHDMALAIIAEEFRKMGRGRAATSIIKHINEE